jgi:hypothetical protein
VSVGPPRSWRNVRRRRRKRRSLSAALPAAALRNEDSLNGEQQSNTHNQTGFSKNCK